MRKIAFLGILYLSGLALLISWQGVAHEAWPSYRFFQFLEILLGAALGFVFWKWRYFLFLFLGMGLPRIYSVLSGHASHASVFPLLLGLSLGGFLVHLFWKTPFIGNMQPRNADRKDFRPFFDAEDFDKKNFYKKEAGLILLVLLLAFETIRAFLDSYGEALFSGEGPKDRILYAGVSANYAWFLASGLSLQLLGPLLFVVTDRLLSWQRRDLGRQFLFALAGLAFLHLSALVLQSLGNLRLAIGAGDAWKATGRLPALMTDSGASSLFFPILLFGFFCWLVFNIEKQALEKRAFAWKAFWRILSFGLVAGLWIFCARYSGRQFFLVSLALCVFWILGRFLLIFGGAVGGGSKKEVRMLFQKLIFHRRYFLLFVIFFGLGIVFWFSSAWSEISSLQRLYLEFQLFGKKLLAGQYEKALLAFLPHRYYQYRAGWQLFLSHPWFGTGLGSFMVYSGPLLPKGIPIDNPGGLGIGLLSDLGFVGFFVLLWAGARILGDTILVYKDLGLSVLDTVRSQGAPQQLPQGDAAELRAFALLLLCLSALFLASFFGYHILYPEYSVFISIILLWRRME